MNISYFFHHLWKVSSRISVLMTLIVSFTLSEFGGDISASSITEFIDNGGNLLMAANSNVGDAIRELASENGFEIDEEGTYVIDHLNHDAQDDGSHTLIVADAADLVDAPLIVGNKKTLNPILFKGTGIISDQTNPLILNVLSASSSAYSYNPTKPVIEVNRNSFLILILTNLSLF